MRGITPVWTVVCFLLIFQCRYGDANFLNQVANYIRLISAYNYYNVYDTIDVIPLEDVARVMEVNVSISLYAINGFDEVAGKMDLVAAMHLSWVDESPLITSSVFSVKDRESFLVPYDKIWTPKLVLENAVGEITEVGDKSYLCSFNMETYQVTWKPRVMISGACTPDVTYYPFDKQICSFTYTGWGFKADEMMFISTSNEWDMTHYEQNGEWTIMETSTVTSIENDQSYITFTIKISRKPLYFAFNIVIPVLLLCCLNSVVFLLPAESGERVGFSVTCFLSFMVILNMVMDIMPRSSSPVSYLCFYLVVMMCNSGAMTLITVLLMRIYFKPEKDQVPKWVSRIVTFINCGCSRLKCCVFIFRKLKYGCRKCFKCKRCCHICYHKNNASRVSRKNINKTKSNTMERQLSTEDDTNSLFFSLTGDQSVHEKVTHSHTIRYEQNSMKSTAKQIVKKPKKSMSKEKMTREKIISSKTKLPSTVSDEHFINAEHNDIIIPKPNYPESPRPKFQKVLTGGIILQPIFDDTPFKNYFKLHLRKKESEMQRNDKRFPFWQRKKLKHTKVMADVSNKALISSPAQHNINGKEAALKLIPDIENQTLEGNSYSPKAMQRHITKKRKHDDLSNKKDETDLNSHTNGNEMNRTETLLTDNDSVGLISQSTSNTDEDVDSLSDIEEDVSWAEVGRVLDVFFFLAFLGAQIFLTVIFFVPIATN